MGDGARRLALDVGTLRVVARRTLRGCGAVLFAVNPGLADGDTAEGGGVVGCVGEGGLFVFVWKNGCVKIDDQIKSNTVMCGNDKPRSPLPGRDDAGRQHRAPAAPQSPVALGQPSEKPHDCCRPTPW